MARDPERKKKSRREDDEAEKPIDVEAELKELESAWDEAEDKGDAFGDVPDDIYQAKVSKANINKSKSSGRLQITYEFTILSGEYKNRKKWAHDGLETKENMDYAKTRLARLGVDVSNLKISGLAEALEQVIGVTCEIKVKTRGDFQNTYVQKLIDVDEVEGGDDDSEDWKPSKRSKREDDEDDEPKKKSKRDEDDDADEDDEPKKKSRRDDDEDDSDDDKPKKKSRDEDDEDEEDDEPKSKKKSDEDDDSDDEDEPKKKSKDDSDDDEDEDDEPKSKKKSRDDEDDDEDEKPRKKKSRF